MDCAFDTFFIKIVPLILAFCLGIVLRQLKLLSRAEAPLILKFVLTATLPALTLLSILKVKLDYGLLYLPLTAQAIVFIIYGIALFIGKRLHLPRTTFGSFLVGCMIMNTAFSQAFFMVTCGTEGFARASLFDIGNSFLIFTFIYYQAIKYGDNGKEDKVDWGKFLKLPPLWGLLLGFLIRLSGWQVPEVGENFLNLIGQPTVPLIMIALGIIFESRIKHWRLVLTGVSIRMGLGLLLSITLTYILGITGLTRTIIIASSATPVGFNTLIFANLENMDRELAAGMISISILLALGFLPLIIWLFG